MSNIKYAPMEPMSGWLEYRLGYEVKTKDSEGNVKVEKVPSDKLDPPVFRCRLRPITDLNLMDGVHLGDETFKAGRTAQDLAIEAVAEWDLAVEGVPVPLTAETKARYLLPIIAEPVEDRGAGILLGVAIVVDARKTETFLKN
jgi:hypothetical protein